MSTESKSPLRVNSEAVLLEASTSSASTEQPRIAAARAKSSTARGFGRADGRRGTERGDEQNRGIRSIANLVWAPNIHRKFSH